MHLDKNFGSTICNTRAIRKITDFYLRKDTMHVEPDLYGKVEASTVDTREPISRKSQSTTYNSNVSFTYLLTSANSHSAILTSTMLLFTST